MLVKNAQNLMQAVVKTLKAAEAACVKVIRRISLEVLYLNIKKNLKKALGKQMNTVLITFQVLHPPEQDASSDRKEAVDIAFQWRKKLKRQRAFEALTASRDQLGLRRRERNSSTPSLADIVHV